MKISIKNNKNWKYEGAQVQQAAAVSYSLNSEVRGQWDVSFLCEVAAQI